VKEYYIYSISRGYRSCTVWVTGHKKARRRVGTLKRTCGPGLTRRQRYNELADFIKNFATAPHYEPTKGGV
jgi:hypothetical protein